MKRKAGMKNIVRMVTAMVVAVGALGSTGQVTALPFNDDMVHEQIMPGQFVRPRAEGTVPVGSGVNYVPPKAEAAQLPNPIERSLVSVLRGKRLFSTNCKGCHGAIGAADYKPGVAGAMMGAPNIVDDAYKAKSDGDIFATIRHGGLVIMPALGWKLSVRETWDIVNYVRHVQTKGPKISSK